MAATLQGTRKDNYTLTNPRDVLIIQAVPVRVTVSDYSHKQDGTPKAAAVTAMPNVARTITYGQAGKVVSAPTEVGQYDIIVGLDSANYRFADGIDNKPRKLGVLSIYKDIPPEVFTIRFESGIADAAGTAPTLPASVAGAIHLLPDNTFTRTGFAFTGWKLEEAIYQSQERFEQPAHSNTVFTAQWKENAYTIDGIVDQEGKPLANVKVVLMRGAERVAETVTNQDGKYTFTSVLPGLYNLVATKPTANGDMIQTIKVEVTAANVEGANITMPQGLTNSVVEVIPGTPKIIVGNLEQTFQQVDTTVYTEADEQTVRRGGIVEIKFKAEEKHASEIAEDAREIAQRLGDSKVGLYLTLDIEKTVTQPQDPDTPGTPPAAVITTVPQSSVLLELVIPLPHELQDKESYSIVRIHDGEVDTLITAADADGEYIKVNGEKTTITLYAKKFSTYAITYTEKSGGGDNLGGGDPPGGGGGGGSFYEEYIITATAHEGGTISPSGKVNVAKYSDKTFTITPDEGWQLEKVLVDGKHQVKLTNGKYTFKSVTESSSIDAYFVIPNIPAQPDAMDKIIPETDGWDSTLLSEPIEEGSLGGTPINETFEGDEDRAESDTLPDEKNSPAGQKEESSDVPEDTVANPPDSLTGVKAADGKPFVLLSALLALAAIALTILLWLCGSDKKHKLIATGAAVAAVLVLLLTSGFVGFAFANLWTLLVAALAAVPVFFFMKKTKEDKE